MELAAFCCSFHERKDFGSKSLYKHLQIYMQSTAPICSRGSCSQWKHCKKITEAKPLLGNHSTAPSIPGTPWYPKLGGKKSKEELRQQHVTAYSQHLRCCKIPAKNGTGLGKQGGFFLLGSDLPPQAGHAVHGHAAAGVFAELGLEQVEPVFHDLAGRRRSVIERPVLRERGKDGKREKHRQIPTGKARGDCFYPGETLCAGN